VVKSREETVSSAQQ